jgi:hypothetical protein
MNPGMARIVTTNYRYKRPPRKKPKQPPLPSRIVTAKLPKPLKRRRQGVMVSDERSTASTNPRSLIVAATR